MFFHKSAYTKYENSEFNGALSPCLQHVNKYIDNRTVLDIGCGDGTYLERFPKGSVGLDISVPNLEICKNKGLTVYPADLNKTLPLDACSFDTVFCSNILEHVDSPLFLLKESNRVLKDNGYLIVCVPNEDSIIHWFYDYFESNGRHLYSFSINNLEALYRETGFDVEMYFGDYHTVLSRKLHLTYILETLHLLPLTMTNKLAHFYWIIGRKRN